MPAHVKVYWRARQAAADDIAAAIGPGQERDWRDDAACLGVDPELFHPGNARDARPAKRICAVCPVRAECLAVALPEPDLRGVWGGTSEHERRIMRREQVAA